jgi:hypothetical protein
MSDYSNSELSVRAVIVCRYRDKVVAAIPCNFVAKGFCGVDARTCDIAILERVY